MRITAFLAEANVISNLSVIDKADSLKQLCLLLKTNGAIQDSDLAFDALITREKLGSTGIGNEIAIPHAKYKDLDQPLGAFAKLSTGVDFGAVDDKQVKFIFMLLSTDKSTTNHLKALARISRLLTNPKFKVLIEEADSSERIFEIIKNRDESLD
ncbi:MAG: PTS sugar transporter subunit IIA [Nitrospinota bacterium]